MGFCIGGHLAFRSATNPEVLAATCCYPTDIHKRSLGKGLNDDTLDRIPEIKGELLVVFGRQDPHVPREGRTTIYNALADAGTNFTWHEFNAAHAFMRDEGARYDAAAARMVYAMALDLFHRKLSEGDLTQIQGSAETRHKRTACGTLFRIRMRRRILKSYSARNRGAYTEHRMVREISVFRKWLRSPAS
jgi:carboxymethylenebutenolidase